MRFVLPDRARGRSLLSTTTALSVAGDVGAERRPDAEASAAAATRQAREQEEEEEGADRRRDPTETGAR